jgi:SAM-dependent methyltransferase
VSQTETWERDYRSRGRLWGGGVKDLPALPAGCRILELGCGNGKTLAALAGRSQRVIALDISPEALRLCHLSVPKVDLFLGDIRRLPFKKKSFDALFAFHVTGHLLLDGRKDAAKEAARVLKSGGKMFFREFCVEDMRAGKGEAVEHGTFGRGEGVITHYFTLPEVEDLFSDLERFFTRIHSWKLRVKGRDLVRSEVEAVFLKT